MVKQRDRAQPEVHPEHIPGTVQHERREWRERREAERASRGAAPAEPAVVPAEAIQEVADRREASSTLRPEPADTQPANDTFVHDDGPKPGEES